MKVGRITEGEVNIEWKAPRKDGGSRTKRYHVYTQVDEKDSTWTEVATVDSFRSYFAVHKLSHTKKYFFGVAAETEAGVGEMGSTEKSVSPKQPLGKVLNSELYCVT